MRVLLLGRKQACADILDHLIDAGHEVVAVITDSHLAGSATTGRAREYGIPAISLEEAIAGVREGVIGFDFGLSVVYWRRIPIDLIRAAPLGIVNLHPAPLPEYKGTAGYNLAILEGLDRWGVSAHYIDEGIDTGEIIKISDFAIDPQAETVVSLERTSMAVMRDLGIEVVDLVSMYGRLPSTPNEGGRYISRRDMEEMKLIRPGDDVPRKIRAFWFPPYAGASVEIAGESYTLVSNEILASLAPQGATSLHTLPAD